MQLVTDKRAPKRLSADFSTEILQARRYGREIFKVMLQGPSTNQSYLLELKD